MVRFRFSSGFAVPVTGRYLNIDTLKGAVPTVTAYWQKATTEPIYGTVLTFKISNFDANSLFQNQTVG